MSDIQQEHFECKSCDRNENYENFVKKLLQIVSNHSPLKSKTVRGDNASFLKKDWRKAIYERTCLRNVYNKKRSRDNCNNYKKQKNFVQA